MSAVAMFLLGGSMLAYYWKTKEHPPPGPTEEEIDAKKKITGYIPPPVLPPMSRPGEATIAAAVSSHPGTYVPAADLDRSLYEAQIKHLNMTSRFVYG